MFIYVSYLVQTAMYDKDNSKLPDFIFEIYEEIIRTNQTLDNHITPKMSLKLVPYSVFFIQLKHTMYSFPV